MQELTDKTQALGSQTTVSVLAYTIRTCRACQKDHLNSQTNDRCTSVLFYESHIANRRTLPIHLLLTRIQHGTMKLLR